MSKSFEQLSRSVDNLPDKRWWDDRLSRQTRQLFLGLGSVVTIFGVIQALIAYFGG